MLARIAGLLVFLILLVYSIPTFHNAYLENKVLKASRHIAEDMREIRKTVLGERIDHDMKFESGENNRYSILLHGFNLLIKKVEMSGPFSGIRFLSFTPEGEMYIENEKTITLSYKERDEDKEEYVFLINQRDYDRDIYSRIARVSWNDKTKEIKIHRYSKSDQEGNIYFKEL